MADQKSGVIRWWGLGVFAVLVLAIVLVWLLVVDRLVKQVIEDEGTEAVGAKVELEDADLTLFPTGLTLTRLQVTNPDEPMTNAVEIASLTMTLDGMPLLGRKVIIEEMGVDGVQFGTTRATSGAIDDRAQRRAAGDSTEEEDSTFTLPPLEVPNVQQILEQEDLETLKLIETIQTDVQREREVWKQRMETLPGKEEFAKYQARVKGLKNSTKGGVGGILGGVEEVKAIQKEIEVDLANLKTAKKEFKDKLALLKQRLAQVKTAPKRDMQRLKEKYSLSPQGLANLGQTLLGKQIGAKMKEVAGWYAMLQPYLTSVDTGSGGPQGADATSARGEGVDIRFKETRPVPDFLIRLANVSLLLDIGEISGKIENITPDQATLGTPLTYAFAGEQLKDLNTVTIQGELDHRQPNQPKDTMAFQAHGYRLQSVAISKQADWPVTLTEGFADVMVDATLAGQAITATGTSELSGLKVHAGKPNDSNPLTKALSSAVSDISVLSVQADVTGTIEQYEVQVRSELDRILKEAAGKMVKNLASSFGKDLQSAISAKVSEPLKALT
ncbi:MAG: TIGR03545 family protein, partial [Nitrospirota bacterium]|nr:TIGR03545 family protein [Nitrospirota bacterium]